MNFQIVKHIIFVLCQIIVIYLQPWTERLASVVEGWRVPSPNRQIHVDSWFSANKSTRMAIKRGITCCSKCSCVDHSPFPRREDPQILHEGPSNINNTTWVSYFLLFWSKLSEAPVTVSTLLSFSLFKGELEWETVEGPSQLSEHTASDVTRRGHLRASWSPFDPFSVFQICT